jgi:hypothetical protein
MICKCWVYGDDFGDDSGDEKSHSPASAVEIIVWGGAKNITTDNTDDADK